MQDLNNPNEPLVNEGGEIGAPATEATTEATEGAIAEPEAQVEGQQASAADDSE